MWDSYELEKDVERCCHCNAITSADVCPNGCESCMDCGGLLEDGICPDCDIRCPDCGYIIVDNECNCPKPPEEEVQGKKMVMFVCPHCNRPEIVDYETYANRIVDCPDCFKELRVRC